ncbi:hydroxyacylglutathione hydrolase [Bdellovibrio bacteriovorus]|uniref:Hydroxyacylglutathione hydrolase n=1 Tax=Bdellovibrio bacteriovorus str. Tiberius TaxID=1069642 RepID=K7ZAR7_BDEBC|nr:hydroxyacylglutathione hydrolase [Bdellovibrio bacteriovorus]AFY01844.1 hydroxyacylglutathione hydrolase GloB [Bdellovibrio bacteriovorus str. Tiberius]
MVKNEHVELIPIFDDNYVFVLIDSDANKAVVVDPGEAGPVADFLCERQLDLGGILLTHHHSDHIGGVGELKAIFNCPVYAPEKNQKQISGADHWLKEGDQLKIAPWEFTILELPGHTLGHIAYWDQQHKWLFSGDVIFGLGCGRLFEGTHEQGYTSLQRIKKLPPQTLIYCTHEYTERNLEFCRILTSQDNTPITGDSEALELYANVLSNRRELGLPSVPLKLSIEESTNPFLLARNVEQFRYLRELRNRQ